MVLVSTLYRTGKYTQNCESGNMQDLPMGDQEAAREAALASVAAQRDAKAKASPPATSAEDVQQPDIPPPSHAPELDNPKSDSTPMEIDQQQASIEEPSKDPVDEPSIVIQTEPTEPDQPSMATPQPTSTATPSRGGSASARGSRSNKSVSFPVIGEDTPTAMTDATPSSARRGRPPGRPRGSRARGPTRGITRGSRGGSRGGRGGKRKRADDDEGDDGASSDSETYAPTTTKSGRNVQKPTTFVPPPQPSPPPMPSFKKKRVYRRNPESAVCKTCLRGVSPASNMIVFCDGCNVPYHRYCHQPPIDQSVIDEVDKEWYCKQCERERIQPVPEAHVVGFVAAENASAEEVCVEIDVKTYQVTNQSLIHRDRSTFQICRQASWSHCSPKQPPCIPTFQSSTLHSSLQVQRAQAAPRHSPPRMATRKHPYNRFRSQQLRYYAMPRTQTMICTAQMSIHHTTRGRGKVS
jgi:hypothetical protein